ncbi:hypothetical protein [uncultured Metabacillus sp.]|uniref:hypothetical protein n=1 Tax=uncultured Metabacillus sp. TaxID=2860135 RepID=UPI00263634FF|nr:hypothetical protein [uncultured Metabacillus sp.]
MTLYLACLLIVNSVIAIIMYRILFKKRRLFNDRFGMIMSMSISGILSLTIAMILQFLYADQMYMMMALTVLIGGGIGILFGSLVKFQSLLAGFLNGIIGSLMGNMLAAVVKDPALCSLPASYLISLEENMVAFSLFGTLLVFMTISLVNYSLRV